MNPKEIAKWISAVVVAVIVAVFGGNSLGAITSPATVLDFLQLQQGLQMPGGPSVSTSAWGTRITGLRHGVCNLAVSTANAPLNASSTGLATCAATGVTAGDRVFMSQGYVSGTATSTFSGNGLAGVNFVTASSTAADTITVVLYNNTGAATSSYALATTSWQWWAVSP